MSAAEEKSEAAAPASSSSSGGGGGSKLVLILSGVNIAVTIAMVAILFLSFQREKKRTSVEDIAAGENHSTEKAKEGGEGHGEGEGHGGKEHPKKATDFGKMVTLDQFTVNLSTPGSATPRFVRVNISIEVPTDDAEGELTSKMPQVRNVIIDLFNSKRPADLATAEGRDYLKDEIRNAINGFLISGKVKGVFFTNFSLAG